MTLTSTTEREAPLQSVVIARSSAAKLWLEAQELEGQIMSEGDEIGATKKRNVTNDEQLGIFRGCRINFCARERLFKVLERLLLTDLEYAQAKQAEIMVWKVCFKVPIDYLQSTIKAAGANPDAAVARLNFFLHSCFGQLHQLLTKLCLHYKWPRMFAEKRRNAATPTSSKRSTDSDAVEVEPMEFRPDLGPTSWPNDAAVGGEQSAKAAAVKNILHFCVLHLGDISRYLRQKRSSLRYYSQATRLSPEDGHAWNQLAISTGPGPLESAYLLLRSLAAPQPFGPAASNLEHFYSAHLARTENKQMLADLDGSVAVEEDTAEFGSLFALFHACLHNCCHWKAVEGPLLDRCLKALSKELTADKAGRQFLQAFFVNGATLKRLLLFDDTELARVQFVQGEPKESQVEEAKKFVAQMTKQLSADELKQFSVLRNAISGQISALLTHLMKRNDESPVESWPPEQWIEPLSIVFKWLNSLSLGKLLCILLPNFLVDCKTLRLFVEFSAAIFRRIDPPNSETSGCSFDARKVRFATFAGVLWPKMEADNEEWSVGSLREFAKTFLNKLLGSADQLSVAEQLDDVEHLWNRIKENIFGSIDLDFAAEEEKGRNEEDDTSNSKSPSRSSASASPPAAEQDVEIQPSPERRRRQRPTKVVALMMQQQLHNSPSSSVSSALPSKIDVSLIQSKPSDEITPTEIAKPCQKEAESGDVAASPPNPSGFRAQKLKQALGGTSATSFTSAAEPDFSTNAMTNVAAHSFLPPPFHPFQAPPLRSHFRAAWPSSAGAPPNTSFSLPPPPLNSVNFGGPENVGTCGFGDFGRGRRPPPMPWCGGPPVPPRPPFVVPRRFAPPQPPCWPPFNGPVTYDSWSNAVLPAPQQHELVSTPIGYRAPASSLGDTPADTTALYTPWSTNDGNA